MFSVNGCINPFPSPFKPFEMLGMVSSHKLLHIILYFKMKGLKSRLIFSYYLQYLFLCDCLVDFFSITEWKKNTFMASLICKMDTDYEKLFLQIEAGSLR